MKTPVLLLKTRSTPHDGYEEYFSKKEYYDPVFIPVLQHCFNHENLRAVKELFISGAFGNRGGQKTKEKYGGLIFTSQRAVEGFAQTVTEIGVPIASAVSHSLVLYTVGPATSRALQTIRDSHLHHAHIYGEEAGNGDDLAHMILEHYNHLHSPNDSENNAGNNDEDHSQKKSTNQKGQGNQKPALFFLVGEQRRDVIPRTLMSDSLPEHQRIQVDELVVYETGAMDSFEGDFRAAVGAARCTGIASDGQVDLREGQGQCRSKIEEGDRGVMWVVVFSPTGCDAMLKVLRERFPSTADSSTTGVEGDRTDNLGRWSRRRCLVATIGPTTRDHLRSKYGFDPEVCAARPSPEGVGKGIEAFMQARQMEQG
ncbi:hypothetical protein Egran_03699 [Elaphomyces granulatus]|uniref:Tetrapyrrole biosynthesis uroporphyrinogen III synthase domain-containing protein n=1 Tax=Elaphomyces granulatus TaxID=519963 RepID=A0A232LWY5_9EURO|nr:hypothetical protein Egran_03699 [Elaphomyces granulatus]